LICRELTSAEEACAPLKKEVGVLEEETRSVETSLAQCRVRAHACKERAVKTQLEIKDIEVDIADLKASQDDEVHSHINSSDVANGTQ